MPTLTSAKSSAERTAADWRANVARVGLAGRGVLYFVLGLFAVDVATGGVRTDTTEGAFQRFADSTYGKVLLLVLCLGLAALVAWKLLQAAAGDPVEGSDAVDRVGYAIKAVAYVALLAAAVSVLVDNWNSNTGQESGGSDSKQEATATVLDWPAGQFLVIVVGLGIIAFGLVQAWTDVWQAGFMDRIDPTRLSNASERGVEVAGRAGYLAKVVTTVMIGGFLAVAGWHLDPDDTTGLSGAVSELGDSGWGGAVLWAVAIGMFGFAAFSIVEAILRRAR